MQCTVCKKQDELSNLVTVKFSEIENGYAHQRCVDQRTKNKQLAAEAIRIGKVFEFIAGLPPFENA